MTTAAEKRHLARVAELGCIICGSPAQVHHIREGQGMGQRAPHFLTIPLCPEHHVGGVSIHCSKRRFEAIYGCELDLLNQTLERLFG